MKLLFLGLGGGSELSGDMRKSSAWQDDWRLLKSLNCPVSLIIQK
jgi:hypothetical protein